MRKTAFYLTVLFALISLTVHIYTISGHQITELFPTIFIVHLLAIILALPCIFIMKRNRDITTLFRNRDFGNGFRLFKIALKTRPKPLIIYVIATFIYAMFIFFRFVFAQQHLLPVPLTGTPHIPGDAQDIARLTRRINGPGIKDFVAFSAMWFYFFSIEAAILWPFGKMNSVLKQQEAA